MPLYRGDSDLGGAGHRLSHAPAPAQPPPPITSAVARAGATAAGRVDTAGVGIVWWW